MKTYIVRLELQNALPDDYLHLSAALHERGFITTMVGMKVDNEDSNRTNGDVGLYHLPRNTYRFGSYYATAQQVLRLAKEAAMITGKSFSIFLTVSDIIDIRLWSGKSWLDQKPIKAIIFF